MTDCWHIGRQIWARFRGLPAGRVGAIHWLAWLVLAASAAVCLPPATAEAQVCSCKKTASGVCERWHQTSFDWALYLGKGKGLLSDDEAEHAATAAFDAWASVQCSLCMQLDPAQQACTAVKCPANPVGLKPNYTGRSALPHLGTACGGVYCPEAAPGTAQIAFIRDPAEWPLPQGVVSAPILAVTKSGDIVDADVLIFDNGKSFCGADCKANQYPIGGALLQEVGHFLGVGYSENTLSVLAANYNAKSASLVPTLTATDSDCVCSIYRTSNQKADCSTAATADDTGCGAARHLSPGWWTALLAAISALILASRGRGYIGANSPNPRRRA